MPLSQQATLGVFTREKADWLLASYSTAHTDIFSAAGKYSRVSIYNNANDGSFLGIMGYMFLKSSTSNNFTISISKGALDSFVSNGVAIDPTQPQPWGQIWGGQAAAAPTVANVIFAVGAAQSGVKFRGPIPRWALAPGYSISSWMDGANIGVCVAWHWCVIPTP